MSDKIYRVQMNSKGMPNFSTAVEITDRPQGEWIRLTDGVGLHKDCGYIGNIDDAYCGRCGARMFAKDINVSNKEGADDASCDTCKYRAEPSVECDRCDITTHSRYERSRR